MHYSIARPKLSALSNASRVTSQHATYVFGLVGACSKDHSATMLAAISLLQRTAPKFPVNAMLSEAPAGYTSLLHQLAVMGVGVINVTSIMDVNCSNPNERTLYFFPTYTIFRIWSLVQYDAVLYLDADLAVIRNVDHVLETLLRNPSLDEIRTPIACTDGMAGFNTGVWAVRPSRRAGEAVAAFVGSRIY